MELWIRVQDNKKLIPGIVKVDNLFVEEDPAENFAWGIKNNGDTLGLYNSKERALELLDEMQKLLIEYYQSLDYKIVPVYEMPEN